MEILASTVPSAIADLVASLWHESGGRIIRMAGETVIRATPTMRKQEALVKAISRLSGPESVEALQSVLATHPHLLTARLPTSHRVRYGAARGYLDMASGKTLLMLSITRGNNDCLRFLIPLMPSGEWTSEDENGDTALTLAACRAPRDIANVMVEAGADINHANKK